MSSDASPGGSPRAYILTLAFVEAALLAAGVYYARTKGIDAATAAPIVGAFLVQAVFFLLPGFPEARRAAAGPLTRNQLAALIVGGALLPYLIYSLPLGLFSGWSFVRLALAMGLPVALLWPRPATPNKLSWRDLAALTILTVPHIAGVTRLFHEIFPSPGEPIPALNVFGRLAAFWVGAMGFLALRPLAGAGFRFVFDREDLRVGLKHFLYYLALGAPLSLALGLVHFSLREGEPWRVALSVAGTAVGFYIGTALTEELCFRGILQNLLSGRLGRWGAQALAALAFGAVHLSFRFYPNWRHSLAAAILGWFCGGAYWEGRSTAAAAVCHTAVVALWMLFFF